MERPRVLSLAAACLAWPLLAACAPPAGPPAGPAGSPSAGSAGPTAISPGAALAPPSPPAELAMPPVEYPLAEVAMTLQRGPCFGFCPVYTVTVHGDGRVEYTGETHVATTGPATGAVSQDEVMALLNTFYRHDFFGLRAEYREEQAAVLAEDGQVQVEQHTVTDMPTQTVTLRLGDWEKTVVDYWNAPLGLKAIEEAIDRTADTGRWVGTPGPPAAAP